MFVLTLGNPNVSDKMLEEIKTYQIELFSNLNVSFKVLNMSSEELGKLKDYRLTKLIMIYV